jgi:biotin-(acetyl-CoA carboxylase) ligase
MSALLAALERLMAEPPRAVLDAWSALDALRGRPIEWGGPTAAPEGRGVAQGIDGDGRLVVALDGGGRTALSAGEVHLRPLR